jgi:hypothetical protein
VVERSARQATPALEIAPRAFSTSAGIVRELGTLVTPGRRERTIGALETALRDLPTTVQRLAELFPATKPLTDCLSSHVVPIFSAKVPDGALSTNRPVWQDFAHGLVGLASAAQNFDGNGYSQRYQFGSDGSTVATETLPGVGRLVGQAPSNLRSRPLPRPDRQPPEQDPDAVCSEQPLPSLETPDGPAGLRPAGNGARRSGPPLTEARIRRLLDRKNLRKMLRAATR